MSDTDDDGLHWTAGLCECELEIAEDLIEIIAEGFSKLSSVIVSVVPMNIAVLPLESLRLQMGRAFVSMLHPTDDLLTLV